MSLAVESVDTGAQAGVVDSSMVGRVDGDGGNRGKGSYRWFECTGCM